MMCGSRTPGRFGTNNNVNICINVNKMENGSQSDFNNLTYLHDKVISLASDLSLLKNNVTNLSSAENFEEKLNNYFNLSEREKLKLLASNESFERLNDFITNYSDFNSLIEAGTKIKYKETIVFLNEFENSDHSLINAIIDGESVIINDVSNSDNDPSTIYKIPIKGFIIGIEMYYMKETDSSWINGWTSYNGLETIYDSENKISYVYLEEENFEDIFSKLRPNNKLKIYSLVIE